MGRLVGFTARKRFDINAIISVVFIMKCFAYIFLAVVLAIAFASDLAAQTKPCLGPRLDLFRPANLVTEGEKVFFSVSVDIDNFDPTDLKYEWRVFPRGKFTTGQNTAVATLDTTGLGGTEAIIQVDVWPVEECRQHESISLMVRRKGPYSKADDFWWWVQLNQTSLGAFNEPDYESWLDQLRERLREVDDRLTIKIERDPKYPVKQNLLYPMKRGFIVGYRAKPYDAKAVKNFISRAPDFAGFEIVLAKP